MTADRLVRDGLPWLGVVVAIFLLWGPPTPWLRQGAVYVSPEGHDWQIGRSPGSAVRTIQRAADMVAPGEEVRILPGDYRETVRVRRGGRPGKPVVFRAVEPGTVVISGAVSDSVVEGLEWRSEGDGIWSAKTPWPIYHVVGDGENFYHIRWGRKNEILRNLVHRPKHWGVFTYENGRLYLAFRDGRSPGTHHVALHRRIPPPYASWTIRSANVWVEADHVVFEGLRFELGVGTGLLLWSARDVMVRDCRFSGAMYGIHDFPRIRRPDGLLVEHSMYDNYPQYHWLKDWLSWKEVYRHHSYNTLVAARADGAVARFNLVSNGADGLELSTPHSASEGVELYGNLLFRGTDDAIELDGFAPNVFVHHNLVYDFFVSLGLSPVLEGPVLIEDNLFLNPPDGVNGSQLKLLNPWKGRGPIRDVAVRDNAFVGNWLAWWRHPVRDIWIVDNVFGIRNESDPPWPPGARIEGNVIESLGSSQIDPGLDCLWPDRIPGGSHSTPERFEALEGGLAGSDQIERFGPRWFDYASDPATTDIPRRISARLLNWQCD